MDKNESESKNTFQTVKSYSNFSNSRGSNVSFSKNVFVPFLSGVIGCSLVIGTCFGIPSIKEKLVGTSTPTSTTSNEGTVDFVSLTDYSNTSVYAANKILPSIVGIEIEYSVNSVFSMFGNSGTSTAKASGSGIIISEDGYILTNNHVVDTSAESNSFYELSSANKIKVKLYNNDTEYEAKIVGGDSQTDLAVLKIDASGLTAAEFADSDSLKVGEFAMVVGNPLGLGYTSTAGIISALNRKITDSNGKTYTLIQTDAAINGGNSGGALVNSEGKVIGVSTMKVSSTDVEGVCFAIPINSTIDITKQLIQYNKVKRPYIGISGVDLDEQTAKSYNLVVGIYVRNVEDFSAAQKAGVKVGDVITAVEGKTIKTMNELNEIKNNHSIGDELKLTVNRDGKSMDITVTLGEQP